MAELDWLLCEVFQLPLPPQSPLLHLWNHQTCPAMCHQSKWEPRRYSSVHDRTTFNRLCWCFGWQCELEKMTTLGVVFKKVEKCSVGEIAELPDCRSSRVGVRTTSRPLIGALSKVLIPHKMWRTVHLWIVFPHPHISPIYMASQQQVLAMFEEVNHKTHWNHPFLVCLLQFFATSSLLNSITIIQAATWHQCGILVIA